MAKLSDAVAAPGTAPQDWQTPNPGDYDFDRYKPVEGSEDLDRILALPRRLALDLKSVTADAIIEMEMRKYSRGERECKCAEIDPQIARGRRTCIKRLLAMQAWMLREINLAKGCLASAVVGGGKTAVGILAPLALGLTPDQVAVLLIPPSLIGQIQVDYQLIAEHFTVPGLTVHVSKSNTQVYRQTGVPTLHVISYNRISSEHSSDLLDHINPAAIIADECDALGDMKSARTKRLLRSYGIDASLSPEERVAKLRGCMFCGWTGSLSNARLSEYAHLAYIALRERSPLPTNPNVTEEWGNVLDASDHPAPAGELIRLCDPGETVRQGFARRIRETLGFVVAMDATVMIESGEHAGQEVGIEVIERVPPKIPDIVQEALMMVRSGERPDTLFGSPTNETLVDAMMIAKCAQEVSCGVVYRWRFPKINGVPQVRDHILKWYARRKEYMSEQRELVLKGNKFLDSAKLVENAARRAWGDDPKDPNKPEWQAKAYPAWRDIRDTVVWEPEAMWLDDWLARDAVDWATTNTGIVWYTISEFGSKVHELSSPNKQERLALHEGGPGAEQRLKAETGERSIICSIRSNGRGRDGLQFIFNKQLVANPPSSGKIWEQLMGRQVRRGQTQHTSTEIYMHTNELRKSVSTARIRAEYGEETLGGEQKLLKGIRSSGEIWAGGGF